jgi:hypothetical protein
MLMSPINIGDLMNEKYCKSLPCCFCAVIFDLYLFLNFLKIF